MDREFLLAFLRLVVFFPLVLVGAYVTIKYGLGRMNARPVSRGTLEVVDRLPVTPKSSLLLVRCGRRYFLIGASEGAPTLLAELGDYGESEIEVWEGRQGLWPPGYGS